MRILLFLIFCLLVIQSSQLFAQSDYFSKGAQGPLFGISYLTSENNNGFLLSSGFTPDARLNIGGDLGRIEYSQYLSMWVIKPKISYLFLKPDFDLGGIGVKQSLAARFNLIDSEYLLRRSLTATERSFMLVSSFFYNIRISPTTMIQPELSGGISFDQLRIWSGDGFEASANNCDEIIGGGLSYFVAISNIHSFRFSTTVEKKGKNTIYYLSISLLHDRSPKE